MCRGKEVQAAPEEKRGEEGQKRARTDGEEVVKEGCWHLFQRLYFIEQHRDFIS